MDQIESAVFFDLRGKTPEIEPWSPNTYKVRAAFALKPEFKYTVRPVPLTELQDTLERVGSVLRSLFSACLTLQFPEIQGAMAPRTVPAMIIKTIDGEELRLMDSENIIAWADKTLPGTPLDPPESKAMRKELDQCFNMNHVGGSLIHLNYRNLADPDIPHFANSRASKLGCSIDEFAPKVLKKTYAQAAAWVDARLHGPVVDMLKRHSGPFMLGPQPFYVDCILAALLQWVEKCDPPRFERMLQDDVVREFWTQFPAKVSGSPTSRL